MEDYTLYIVSGYKLDLYCNKCKDKKWPERRNGDGVTNPVSFHADGKDCYSRVRKFARKAGWILKKDGTAICPRCTSKRAAGQIET